MLEEYFVKPRTVDRIRGSWIGPQIEQYVTWLAGQGYGTRCVLRRVPLVTAFGEFAAANGARQLADLPEHVSAFVSMRVSQSRDARRAQGDTLAKDIRGPVEQMLTIVLPGYSGSGRPRRPVPFGESVPGFFEYLVSERGLRPASVESYVHYLRRFEDWLARTGVTGLEELSPPLLSAFTAERACLGLAKTSVREGCGVLRVFLRYARREGVISKDLTGAVEWPQAYRGAAVGDRGHRPRPPSPDPGGQGQGRRPGPAGHPHRAAGVAVHPGGVHRDDRHPVREPGRAAGLLAQGNRHPGTRPRPTRTRDQGGGRVRSGGGSFGRISLHVGQDWWTFLNTYDDHSPILDVAAGSTTVTFSIADRKVDASALEFARELASQAAGFAAEVERLHAQHGQDTGTGEAGSGRGEAA